MQKWKELKRFCDNDGWECYKITDHYFYRKILPDGEILFTKISMVKWGAEKFIRICGSKLEACS